MKSIQGKVIAAVADAFIQLGQSLKEIVHEEEKELTKTRDFVEPLVNEVETNDLPEILTAKHISDYLGISRHRVYELFQQNPAAGGIPNLGLSKRVDKQDFMAWINDRKQEKAEKVIG